MDPLIHVLERSRLFAYTQYVMWELTPCDLVIFYSTKNNVVCRIILYGRMMDNYNISLLLLFAMVKSVVKSFIVPVVEVADLTNRFHCILP